MPKKLHRHLAWALILLACSMLAAVPVWAADQTKVRLQLQWVHQAQFAGFYLAQDMGIYAKAGLKVDIRAGGPGISPLDELAKGKCDFATAWLAGGLEKRSQGLPVMLLAQLFQRSSLLLVTLADRDIENVKDLEGRKVGLWGGQFSLAPRALFSREKINVREVPQNASVTPLLSRAVDACGAMRYNEYHQLYQDGVNFEDIVVLDFADMGLNFPEDGVYTLEKTWRGRKDVCRRFTAASLEGWRMALRFPEKALASVMRRVDAARLASNISHQRWMLKTILQAVFLGQGEAVLGRLSSRDYNSLQKVLLDQGLIKQPVKIEDFFVRGWETKP